MAHIHHEPTIVEDRDGSSTALIAILLVVAAVFLVWLFAFSGWVFDNDNSSPSDGTRIEQQIDNGSTSDGGTTDGGTTDGGTTTESDTGDTEPAPVQS